MSYLADFSVVENVLQSRLLPPKKKFPLFCFLLFPEILNYILFLQEILDFGYWSLKELLFPRWL